MALGTVVQNAPNAWLDLADKIEHALLTGDRATWLKLRNKVPPELRGGDPEVMIQRLRDMAAMQERQRQRAGRGRPYTLPARGQPSGQPSGAPAGQPPPQPPPPPITFTADDAILERLGYAGLATPQQVEEARRTVADLVRNVMAGVRERYDIPRAQVYGVDVLRPQEMAYSFDRLSPANREVALGAAGLAYDMSPETFEYIRRKYRAPGAPSSGLPVRWG